MAILIMLLHKQQMKKYTNCNSDLKQQKAML